MLSILLLAVHAATLVCGSPLASRSPESSDYTQLQTVVKEAQSTAMNLLAAQKGACAADKVEIRKSWDDFTTAEKKNYVAAVLCLQSKKALTPPELGSGIKTRFDDFVATHMNQTQSIHWTGNFLTWHRYYIHLFQQTMKDECGYTGTLPYWDWPKTAITGMHASPVFDGSDTSMSGDGAFIPNRPDILVGNGLTSSLSVPAGTGGGCVTSGPFVNYTVNLGPVKLQEPGNVTTSNPNNDTGIFSWNPRCMKRDLTDFIVQNYANATSVLDVLKYADIDTFQMIFQGISPETVAGGNTLGVHGGGHFALGGDPARDAFISPADPAFFMHHAMMDRVWWTWQMQDPASRISGSNALAGTKTFMNNPPSANTEMEDDVGFDFAAGPRLKIKDLLSTTAGPFCYVYI